MESGIGVDSIVDSISQLILSRSDSQSAANGPEPQSTHSESKEELMPVQDRESLLIQSINKTREELGKRLKHELKGLAESSTKNSSTRTSVAPSVTESSERLFNAKKKMAEKLEAKINAQLKKEQEELKAKPDISQGSKRLLQTKGYIPIYSKERLKQIEAAKKQKVERLRQEVELKKKQAEEEDLAKSVPVYKGSEITNVELCFDPETVKPMVYEQTSKKDRVSSLDEELKTRCSFRPSTDKHSDAMFAKRNLNSKGVVERLIDYGKYQKKAIEQKVVASRPPFKPQKYVDVKKSSRNKAWGFQTKEETQSRLMDIHEDSEPMKENSPKQHRQETEPAEKAAVCSTKSSGLVKYIV